MRKKIADEAQRGATFNKKVGELLKEANELSTLCGVEMGIVVHKEGEDNAVTWPSRRIFNESLQKFLNFSEPERAERMTTHVDFLEQLVAAEARKMAEARERLQMRKAQQLLAQVTTGEKRMEELDFHQLQGLASFASEMLRKIGNRENELKGEGSGTKWALISCLKPGSDTIRRSFTAAIAPRHRRHTLSRLYTQTSTARSPLPSPPATGDTHTRLAMHTHRRHRWPLSPPQYYVRNSSTAHQWPSEADAG
ncbi:Unknown protein [Striga hermonthica]|uniref:MADS-box domain-containing protein n=1 Tax=Striga hermonthica TaxID=68872 RepID=A0A9N7RRH0_STRHE|nr:Unknown protein [Striga hermonthica]